MRAVGKDNPGEWSWLDSTHFGGECVAFVESMADFEVCVDKVGGFEISPV